MRPIGQMLAHRPLFTGVLAGLLVGVFALPQGFFTDDYIHLMTFSGAPTPGGPFDLFCFGRGNPDELQPFLARGLLPWFTLPELKIWFFRPLSSATMALDYVLFGEAAAAYHLHSVLWYLAAILAVWLLLRRLLPGDLLALSLLVFALDVSHMIPVGWWSSRSALVAAVPALLGLCAHLRWREEHWRPGLPLSLLGYALGLLGGESVLGVFGYLAAYEASHAFHDRTRPFPAALRSRPSFLSFPSFWSFFKPLAPAGLLCTLYLLFYRVAGYGVSGSGGYVDPAKEPLQFLRSAPDYFFGAVATEFMLLQRELAGALPLAAIGAAVFVALLVLLALLWLRVDGVLWQTISWIAVGAALSALPALSGAGSGRLLFFPSIGAAVMMALIIQEGWRARGSGSRVLPAAAGSMFLLHIVLAPFCWAAASYATGEMNRQGLEAVKSIPLDAAAAPRTRLIVLTQPDPLVGVFGPMMRAAAGAPMPAKWWNMTIGVNEVVFRRTGEPTAEAGFRRPILRDGFEQTFRDNRHPFREGEVVALGELNITVIETLDGQPLRIAVEFERDLDDPEYLFVRWGAGRYEKVTPPSIGEEITLKRGAPFPAWP
ncbi:MAG: hypothetical protein HYV26_08040 [Candidatus Hydrogenedentes bacterium]|nr:hypothetical protein [Candidatus Hydrogenedentota bacterium]MBI3117667.1 hypothetical protein [Candidatus Hydrogenedentota bacterium]